MGGRKGVRPAGEKPIDATTWYVVTAYRVGEERSGSEANHPELLGVIVSLVFDAG
ncbi:MAG: hypothetical protein ETSY2_26340 [Candidatus Entotheonella gemina]|uniref:Uncharacterized protein n=1 Tax=Candidatus Entotheonella gemina TaxID=1429439 RepID=W4M5G7_9BACT|nr:MAG: hypothetical protein ETSY2_26340 [Candidatus Entotheonella gemina]